MPPELWEIVGNNEEGCLQHVPRMDQRILDWGAVMGSTKEAETLGMFRSRLKEGIESLTLQNGMLHEVELTEHCV